MNAQGKLLLYIAMICLIFYFVQDRFNLFDIQFISDTAEEEQIENDGQSYTRGGTEDSFSIENGTLTISREESVPIIVSVEIADTEDERAQGELKGFVDYVVSHNRDIVHPVDDSVLFAPRKYRQIGPLPARLSRG